LVVLSISERVTVQGWIRPEQNVPRNWTLVLPILLYRLQYT
jgi:hypothetical protein